MLASIGVELREQIALRARIYEHAKVTLLLVYKLQATEAVSLPLDGLGRRYKRRGAGSC